MHTFSLQMKTLRTSLRHVNISSNETNAIIPKQSELSGFVGLEFCFKALYKQPKVEFPSYRQIG